MTDSLEPGDHVFVGAASPRKVHWTITSIQHGHADLESGMTGRRTTVPIDSLTLHTKGSPA